MAHADVMNIRKLSVKHDTVSWKEIPDQQLIELCLKGGEEDAWVEFLRRYRALMIRVIARTLRPSIPLAPGLLMDLFQEVLVKLCANGHRPLRRLEWRHEGSLRGLLRVVSSTVTQDYIRRCFASARDVRLQQPLDEYKLDRDGSGPLAVTEHKILLEQLTRRLAEAIHSESNWKRDIAMFLLYYRDGVRASELARHYRLGIKTVEARLARLALRIRRL